MFTLPQLALGFVIALVLIVAEYFLTVKMRSPLWGGISISQSRISTRSPSSSSRASGTL